MRLAQPLRAHTDTGRVVVVIQDHLALPNLTGMNPLLGPPAGPNYPRFLPLSSAYSASLRRLAFLASHKLKLGLDALAEGVYAWVSGPTYETPAEGRMLRNAGADVVGMSTVPEVLVGKEEGLEVMVLSLVTNMVVIPQKYRSIKEEVEAEVSPCARLLAAQRWHITSRSSLGALARGEARCTAEGGDGVARGGAANWQAEGGGDEESGREDCRADRERERLTGMRGFAVLVYYVSRYIAHRERRVRRRAHRRRRPPPVDESRCVFIVPDSVE